MWVEFRNKIGAYGVILIADCKLMLKVTQVTTITLFKHTLPTVYFHADVHHK